MSVDTSWQPGFHVEAIAGDRRYHYVPFYELSQEDQRRARRAYPHKSGGKYAFVDEHYLYPVRKNGKLGHANRELAIPYALIQNDGYMESLGYVERPGWHR